MFITVHYCSALFIGLYTLFISHEQCIKHWFFLKKKKNAWNANVQNVDVIQTNTIVQICSYSCMAKTVSI